MITRSLCFRLCLLLGISFLGGAGLSAPASAQSTLVLDDFEDGVGKWTRNDKIKSDTPASNVMLVDVLATRPMPGGAEASQGAALFTFKAAKGSWASASLKVNGNEWGKIGARVLRFWLNAGGDSPGVELMLRGSYRQSDGSLRDEVFELPIDPVTKRPKTILLDKKQWREVAIPLSDFHDRNGRTLPGRVSGIYLLQFVQRGTWNSRFFTIDDIRIVGTGIPAVKATPAPTAATAAPQTPATPETAASTIPVNVDFLRTQGRIRSAANASIGASYPTADGMTAFPLEENAQFRAAIDLMNPKFLRLDAGALVELIDSSRPAFDFGRLLSAARRARNVGAEPLISLPNPPEWGLDARGYALFVTQAARLLNAGNPRPVRYFELATATSPSTAVAFYKRAYTSLKALSKSYRVGGIGASSASQSTLKALLDGASGLDFLSVHFFGATNGAPSTPALFASAVNITTLKSVASALDKSKWKNAPLYVTQANMSAARTSGDVAPSDGRLVQLASAAWWTSFLGNASRLSDQIFHNDAVNPEWGLLNQGASAYPSYYALWMWNTFFPPGSVRAEVKIDSADIVGAACNTATAHNVLLANTSDREITARMTIRGFPVLRAARMRILQDPLDPRTGVRFSDLPKSPFQTIKLASYAVAVLQFIEPPAKKAAPKKAATSRRR
ncbi:MAG: hypothetical protein JWN98_908 [Abditibacteriota bacterium]|nr:hypothetical protein [Abditibacteriota bacterium]